MNEEDIEFLSEQSKSLIESLKFDAAEELLLTLFDQDHDPEHIYLLSKAIFQKGDYQRAVRIISKAIDYAPDELKYRDQLELIQSKISNIRLQTSGRSVPRNIDRKFDFLVAPVCRGGSRFISTCLTMHPDVYVPNRDDLSATQRNSDYEFFLESHQDIFKALNPLQAGLVQHGGTIGDARNRIPEQLAEIVNNEMFIMSVRNPFVAARSVHNHDLVAGTSKYRFHDLGIAFMNGAQTLSDLISNDWKLSNPDRKINLPKSSFEFFKSISLDNFRLHKTEQNYLRSFGACETIDGHQLIIDKENELKYLFDLIGVDNSFTHPFFDVQLSDPFQATMQLNPFDVDVFGQKVKFRLTYAGFTKVLPEFVALTEVAKLEPDERFRELGLPDFDICLAAYTADWIKLPRTIRQKVIAEKILEQPLSNTIFPRWIEAYRQFMDAYADLRWEDEPPPGAIEYLKENIADEAIAFLKNHPRHEEFWTDIHEIIGN